MDNKLIRKRMLINEKNMQKYASRDREAIRLNHLDDDFRPNYYRDIDRIIHSFSYTRYIDKTQVFSQKRNDHISKRIIHVQLVSKVARTIGRALGLNEDLIEAIALGHDIGHTPFGHVGESILNEISLKNGEGYFNHNAQSVRTLMILENHGYGKNLTVQTLDGILCHNGELIQRHYEPKKKSVADFLLDYNNTYSIENYSKKLIPMTLEGCVVRVSDIIGYLGRDIEDALELGVIKKEDLPESIIAIIGNNNSDIINNIVVDIITQSYNKPYLEFSSKVFEAIKDLKEYNTEKIYLKANTKENIEYYQEAYNALFNYYLKEYNNPKCSINTVFLGNMNSEYIQKNSKIRIIIDYLAGMTDDFFINEYKKIIGE